MRILNHTPHEIVVVVGEERIRFPSVGLARVDNSPGFLETHLMNCPLYSPDTTGEISGLPEPEEGTFYLISVVVAAALSPERKAIGDCLIPGTGPKDMALRFPDGPQKGQIRAVTRLKRA